jgi:hypothetical protein
MKRDRQAEGGRLLMQTEETLRQSLLDWLPLVAVTGEAIFTNSQFSPVGLPKHLTSQKNEALLEAASACIEIREALQLPVQGSIGELFLRACEEAASPSEHRRGPRRLAEALLEQIRHV